MARRFVVLVSTFCVCKIFHNKKKLFKVRGKKRQEFTTKSKFGHYSWVLKNCRKPLTKQTPQNLTVVASKNCREMLRADFFCQQTFSLQHSWELFFPRGNVLLPGCKQDVLIPNWTLPASFPWENLFNYTNYQNISFIVACIFTGQMCHLFLSKT